VFVENVEFGAREYVLEHHPHLELSERRADASPDASAERDPRERWCFCVDPPLGLESQGFGECLRISLQQQGGLPHAGSCGDSVSAEYDVAPGDPAGERNDRA
jgi:hypothetical protein